MSALPGADLVEAGLADLAAGVESVEALLVSIGARRVDRSVQTDARPSRASAPTASAG